MSADHTTDVTDPNPTPPTIDADDELIAGGMTVAGTEIMVFDIPGSEGYKRLTVGGNSIVLDGWTANHLGQALAGIGQTSREMLTFGTVGHGTTLPVLPANQLEVIYDDLSGLQEQIINRAVSEDTLRAEITGSHVDLDLNVQGWE